MGTLVTIKWLLDRGGAINETRNTVTDNQRTAPKSRAATGAEAESPRKSVAELPTLEAALRGGASRLWRIVQWLDQNGKSFLISRLILKTGIKLRDVSPSTADEPKVLEKLSVVLRGVLSPKEWTELSKMFGESAGASQEKSKTP